MINVIGWITVTQPTAALHISRWRKFLEANVTTGNRLKATKHRTLADGRLQKLCV